MRDEKWKLGLIFGGFGLVFSVFCRMLLRDPTSHRLRRNRLRSTRCSIFRGVGECIRIVIWLRAFFHSPFGDRSILRDRITTKEELHRFTKCDEGWGNYLLAGLLKSLKAVRSKSSASNGFKYKSDAGSAFGTAIKVATAKAWGWTKNKTWPQVKRQIKASIDQM